MKREKGAIDGIGNGTGNGEKTGFIETTGLIMALLMMAFSVSAAPIPASISGVYDGSGTTAGWRCTILAFEISAGSPPASNRALSYDCTTPSGPQRLGAVTTDDACPDENDRPFLAPVGVPCGPAPDYCNTPATPRASITGYATSAPGCPLGTLTITIVPFPTTGGGVSSTFCRSAILTPAVPYAGCTAPAAEREIKKGR